MAKVDAVAASESGKRIDAALKPFAPGATLGIASEAISVEVAPNAGGRIVQIRSHSVDWLHSYRARDAASSAMIAWGCYPMLPWAGRIRHGRFDFHGQSHQLPINLGQHAIHGVGFAMPWQVDSHSSSRIELSLQLPEDQRWPFGGRAQHVIEVGPRWLRMRLSVTTGTQAMPVVIGWHPWLLKHDHLDFTPTDFFPRDKEGIATRPLRNPPPPPWDDCFVNHRPVIVKRAGQTLRLVSDCRYWVIYDQPEYATCVEPQSGPPDAFNLEPEVLEAGAERAAWFLWEWL